MNEQVVAERRHSASDIVGVVLYSIVVLLVMLLWVSVQAQRHSAAGHCRHDREWPDPGAAWRGALAADRSGAMDLRGIPHHNRQADAQPGAASHGLPQTVGPTASPCASRGRDRRF